MSSSINKPAADISAAANEGKKDGLAETGGVAGALAKEREARGVSADDAADAHGQDNPKDAEHGKGTGAAN